jgi:hypothetical protein
MADAENSTPTAPALENAAPSPASPEQATPSPSTPTGETTAPSPSAKPATSREALLEAVQKAVPDKPRPDQLREGEGAGGASPAPAAKSDAASHDEEDLSDLSDDPTPQELLEGNFQGGGRRRVKKLLRQRDEARNTAETQRAQIEQLNARMPQAEAAASVQKYLIDNDIGKDDFLLTLELAAAMRRGDFRAFYEGVKPYVDLAEQYLGVSLPQDLQQRVREGHMTTEAARLFARERMDRGLADTARLRTAQRYDQTVQQTAQQNLSAAVVQKVNAWEQATMQSDPDYAAKKPLLQDVMWSVVRERGAPPTPDAAVEIAKEAYRRVNEHSARWAPPKRPTSRQPSSTGRTNGAAPEAKNLKEAVAQAIERARA